jgi:hypothetical protein
MTPRVAQAVLIVAMLVASWLGMQAVHELGHVIGAVATGGRVTHVSLHPLSFSRTDVEPNPRPMVVVWAGPLLGVLLPVLLWRVGAQRRWACDFVLRFFAGACCVINGVYIALGSTAWAGGVGDCGVMLRHGSPMWVMWVFGAATVPAGFWLWHGQGAAFAKGSVSWRVAMGTAAVAVALVGTGLAVGR